MRAIAALGAFGWYSVARTTIGVASGDLAAARCSSPSICFPRLPPCGALLQIRARRIGAVRAPVREAAWTSMSRSSVSVV